jgi:hypothetical protein
MIPDHERTCSMSSEHIIPAGTKHSTHPRTGKIICYDCAVLLRDALSDIERPERPEREAPSRSEIVPYWLQEREEPEEPKGVVPYWLEEKKP